MTVILKDIAERLNVSITTVSRSLKQDPRIPQETRARVLSLAAQIGYRPRTGGRDYVMNFADTTNQNRKQTRESVMIAVFVQADDVHAEQNAFKELAGIGNAAQDHNLTVVLHAVPFSRREVVHLPENQPEVMRDGKVKGIIFVNMFDHSAVARLSRQVACVSIDILYSGLHMDCVGEENIESIGKAVEHLHSLGHRKIGYIDPAYENSVTRERFGGYMAGMLRLGLGVNPEWTLHSRRRRSSPDADGLGILHQWIQQGVTGLVCMNDAVAIDVYRWLKSNGYRCPEDISITGFDHQSLPADVPELTTFSVHFQDLGRLAVERLVARLNQPVIPPTRLTVECELVAGKTTGRRVSDC